MTAMTGSTSMPFSIADPEKPVSFTQNSDCRQQQFTTSLAQSARPEGIYNTWKPIDTGLYAFEANAPFEIACPLCGKCPIIVKYWVSASNSSLDTSTPENGRV
jgi:hypothetical protein